MSLPQLLACLLAEVPDECPMCHHGIEPKYLYADEG